MSDVCLPVTNERPAPGRARQIAWQVALFFPFVAIAVAGLAFGQSPPAYWQTASGLILLAAVGTAAVTDALWRKIPNWITYSACLWGLALNAFALTASPRVLEVLGTVGLLDSLAGACLPFFFMLVIFSMTGGGAGDVKLTAAMGALLGLSRVVDAILLSFIFAGGFALIRAVWLQGPKNLFEICYRTVGHWVVPLWILPPNEQQRTFMRQPMPLGPSFALGTALVLFNLDVASLLELLQSVGGGK